MKEEDVLGVVECEDELRMLLPTYSAVLAAEPSVEEGKASTSTASPLAPPSPPQGFLSTLVPFLGFGS